MFTCQNSKNQLKLNELANKLKQEFLEGKIDYDKLKRDTKKLRDLGKKNKNDATNEKSNKKTAIGAGDDKV